MPISCVTSGRSFLKSINQPMSLTTIFLIFISFVIVSSLGISLYKKQVSNRIELCENFVYNREISGTDYETSFVLCILCSVVFFILFGMSLFQLRNSQSIGTDLIFPLILLIVGCICGGLSKYYHDKYDEEPPNKTLQPDGRVVQWCLQNRDETRGMYWAIAIVLAIGVAAFLIYMTDLVTSICVVYSN